MSNQENIIASFTQCPNIVLYGLPHLPMQDRWALLALMGQCWDRSRDQNKTLKELEGPYKLSLREISTITGVSHTHLRKQGGKYQQGGTLDRLQSIGYVTVIEARPIDDVTGKPGRLQTYIYIHLEKIWQDNQAFTEKWNRPAGKLVKPSTFLTDSNSSVTDSNTTVTISNTTVTDSNTTVTVGNVTVTETSSKSRQYKSNTINTKKERENTSSPEKEQVPSRPDSSLSLSSSVSLKEKETRDDDQPQPSLQAKEKQGTLGANKATSGTSSPSHAPAREASKQAQASKLTPEVVAQMDAWDEIKGIKAVRDKWHIEAATLAAEQGLTKDDLRGLIEQTKRDNKWYVPADQGGEGKPITFGIAIKHMNTWVEAGRPKGTVEQPSSGGFILQTDGAARWAEKREEKKMTRREMIECLRRNTVPGRRNFSLESLEEQEREYILSSLGLGDEKEAFTAYLKQQGKEVPIDFHEADTLYEQWNDERFPWRKRPLRPRPGTPQAADDTQEIEQDTKVTEITPRLQKVM